MAWIASLAGAGMSAYSGKKSGDAASHAQEMQEKAMLEDQAFRRKIYEEERAFSNPIRESLKKEALSSQPLDYAENKAQIDREMAAANRAAAGMNYGLGMANSGQALNAPLLTSLAGATAKSKAWAEGQKARRSLALGVMGYANPMGAAGGVSEATRGLGGMYGNYMGMYNQGAQMGYAGAAQGIKEGIQGLADQYGWGQNDASARYDYKPMNDNIPQSRTYGYDQDLSATPSVIK